MFGGKDKNRPRASAQDLDQMTRAQIAKAGGDLAKLTEIVNYLHLPGEAKAQATGAELHLAGYEVTVCPAATGPQWLALEKIEMSPSEENIARLRERFEGLATKFRGDYDGWEAAVTE